MILDSSVQKVAPHIDYGARVGALFAQGGFDWAVKQAFGPERWAFDDIVLLVSS